MRWRDDNCPVMPQVHPWLAVMQVWLRLMKQLR
jgi:hypothetical protein